MVCKKCNYNNPEGAAFCQGCGSPLTEEPAPEGNGSGGNSKAVLAKLPFKLDKKVLIGAVAAVAAVILLIVIISAIASSGSDFIEVKNYIDASYNEDDDETTFSFNSKVLGDKIEGSVTRIARSADGSNALCAISNANEDDEDEDDAPSVTTYTIYHVSKSGVKKVFDSATNWSISLDGKRACYIDEDGVLYAYTLGGGKSEKVAEDVRDTPVMSPDGKTILYVVTEEVENDEDEDEDEYDEPSTTTERKLYSWKNGKSNSIGKNYSPVAVSDNGKYVYITLTKDGDRGLYVTKIGSDDKSKLEGDVDQMMLNYDRTEILYSSGSKAYLSVKGKDGVKVGGMSAWGLLVPDGCNGIVKTFLKVPMAYTKDTTSLVASIGFIKKAGKEYEIVRLVSNVTYAVNTGDMIYYTKSSDDLCRIKIKENAEAETLAEDIVSFKMSASGKIAYALDDDDTLWKINGKKKDKVIDDVVSDNHFFAFGEGVIYVAEYDSKSDSGTLYYSSNGKNKTKIAEEVTYIYVPAPGLKVVTYSNEDGDEFISGDAKKYNKY